MLRSEIRNLTPFTLVPTVWATRKGSAAGSPNWIRAHWRTGGRALPRHARASCGRLGRIGRGGQRATAMPVLKLPAAGICIPMASMPGPSGTPPCIVCGRTKRRSTRGAQWSGHCLAPIYIYSARGTSRADLESTAHTDTRTRTQLSAAVCGAAQRAPRRAGSLQNSCWLGLSRGGQCVEGRAGTEGGGWWGQGARASASASGGEADRGGGAGERSPLLGHIPTAHRRPYS